MDMGFSIDEAAKTIRFSLAITSNYFMEMAKLRAGRMLWANIVKAYNPEKNCACKMFTHAVTSSWNQTAYDPYVNMLRGTTEAMSATIAGIHSLEVTPFNAAFEDPNDFSMRIARNVELLLKHEAHFDQVVDPAGGSYYIENLTQSIANEAWKLFARDRGEGRLYGSLRERLHRRARQGIRSSQGTRTIATRRLILLGANQYPQLTEVAGKDLTEKAVTRTEARATRSTPVIVAPWHSRRCVCTWIAAQGGPRHSWLTCGSLAMARARSQFSCNFFACAGIPRNRQPPSSNRLRRASRPHWSRKPRSWSFALRTTTTQRWLPKSRSCIGGKAILVVAVLRPACPNWRLKASELYQRKEQRPRNVEILPERNGYLKSENHESKIFRLNIRRRQSAELLCLEGLRTIACLSVTAEGIPSRLSRQDRRAWST